MQVDARGGGRERARAAMGGGPTHLEMRTQLGLQLWLVDPAALHGVGQVHGRDVPAADDDVVRLNHRQQRLERHVALLAVGAVAEHRGGGLRDGTEEVGALLPALGFPFHVQLVGDERAGHGAAVVAAQADDHHAQLRHLGLGLEGVLGRCRRGDKSTAFGRHGGGLVLVLRRDVLAVIADILGVDREALGEEIVLVSHGGWLLLGGWWCRCWGCEGCCGWCWLGVMVRLFERAPACWQSGILRRPFGLVPAPSRAAASIAPSGHDGRWRREGSRATGLFALQPG